MHNNGGNNYLHELAIAPANYDQLHVNGFYRVCTKSELLLNQFMYE